MLARSFELETGQQEPHTISGTMDRGNSGLRAKIAQFEAPNGEVNGTPARTTPAQKSTPNPSWQAAEKIKTTNKTDFQSCPRNLVEQSRDGKFEKPRTNEQRPKPAIKPLELAKASQKSDINSENWISRREEILLSPTTKNHQHIENLSKIISAQGANSSSRSEPSKLKSPPYSTVVPQLPSSQVKQKFPDSGSKSFSPVNEHSVSGFPPPSNPKNISRPDPSEHKVHLSVPKPPKPDVFRNASTGDRTLHKVAAISLSNQPQSNEVPLYKTERSSPGSQSPTPRIPGLQTSKSYQKSMHQTSPKIKTAEDKADVHRNGVSKPRHQTDLNTVTDVTRNASRRSNTDHVTDVHGRRYRRLSLADDIPAKPSKKPPKLPFSIDLEKFRPFPKNTVEETPGMLPRVVSLIPEWSVEEEEGENDQEDYEVCIDNCPMKDGYVNEHQLKNTDSIGRLKTNTGSEHLSDEEIYESI